MLDWEHDWDDRLYRFGRNDSSYVLKEDAMKDLLSACQLEVSFSLFSSVSGTPSVPSEVDSLSSTDDLSFTEICFFK